MDSRVPTSTQEVLPRPCTLKTKNFLAFVSSFFPSATLALFALTLQLLKLRKSSIQPAVVPCLITDQPEKSVRRRNRVSVLDSHFLQRYLTQIVSAAIFHHVADLLKGLFLQGFAIF